MLVCLTVHITYTLAHCTPTVLFKFEKTPISLQNINVKIAGVKRNNSLINKYELDKKSL